VNVPGSSPVAVTVTIGKEAAASVSMRFATPKSITLTCPSGVSITFEGFRSRWTMPASWAFASAPAISIPYRRASAVVSGPRTSLAASVSPPMNSITRYAVSP
jgi:hypothetical protein